MRLRDAMRFVILLSACTESGSSDLPDFGYLECARHERTPSPDNSLRLVPGLKGEPIFQCLLHYHLRRKAKVLSGAAICPSFLWTTQKSIEIEPLQDPARPSTPTSGSQCLEM